MTYQELAHQIVGNDCEIAFAEFYKKYRYWVYQSAIKMLHCPFDAEEAVNDVFAKIWKVRKSYDKKKGAWLTWVGIVAERFLFNAYRTQQRDKSKRIGDLLTEPNPDSDELATIADSYPVNHLDAIVISEQMQKIENALCELPCRESRAAWILRHVECYTYAEIGRIIKRSEVVSQRRVKSATHLIRESIAD